VQQLNVSRDTPDMFKKRWRSHAYAAEPVGLDAVYEGFTDQGTFESVKVKKTRRLIGGSSLGPELKSALA
jgi:hypothetical protein